MQSTTNSTTTQNNQSHQDLADRAALLRDRVAQTFKQLDKRWPGLSHFGEQLREHKVAVIVGGSAALLTLAGGIAYGVKRMQDRKTLSYKVRHSLEQVQSALHN